jgi:hypothetical protein
MEPTTINSNELAIIDAMKLEARELDTRLELIIDFINNNPKYAELSHTAGILLLEQRDVMVQYLDILTKRINLLVEESVVAGLPHVEPVDELPEHRFLSPDEITEEMREAGVDETTPIITDPEAIAKAQAEIDASLAETYGDPNSMASTDESDELKEDLKSLAETTESDTLE